MIGTNLLAIVVATASMSTAHAQTVGPCSDGGWGHIDSVSPAVHVRAGGDDLAGDGTEARPFATLARALQATRALPASARRIAVGPGSFAGGLTLDQASDNGLVVQGCGPDETLLAGGGSAPVLDVSAAGAVALAGLGLTGGVDALTIRGGASATVDAVEISNTSGRGLVVQGATTVASLTDVTIRDVQASSCGAGASIVGATVDWTRGGVEQAEGLGIFADEADLTLVDVDVADTAPAFDDTLGRGLHAQYSRVSVDGGQYTGNRDASIYLLDVLNGSSIFGVVITLPGAGVVITLPGAGRADTGEGIVVKSTGAGGSVELVGNTIDGAPRAAILVDGAEVEMSGNTASDTGLYDTYGAHFFAQHDADIVGSGIVTLSDSSALITGDQPLSCAP